MSILEFLQSYSQAILQETLVTCAQFVLATLVAVAADLPNALSPLVAELGLRFIFSVLYLSALSK